MRKNLWMFAAILFSCGLSLSMVSCANNDNIVFYDDNSEEYFEPSDPTPTADQLAVKIDGLTYVMDAPYADEGKALRGAAQLSTSPIDQ